MFWHKTLKPNAPTSRNVVGDWGTKGAEMRCLRCCQLTLGIILGLSMDVAPLFAQATMDLRERAEGAGGLETLNLLVIVNGRDTGIVAEFQRNVVTGELTATPADLAALGLKVPLSISAEISLNALTGLQAVYDAAGQTLLITALSMRLLPQDISLRPSRPVEMAKSGWGVVLNYDLTANLGDDITREGLKPKALYTALDLRAATPLGVFHMTGSAATLDGFGDVLWHREETAFVHVAQSQMRTITFGDFASTGLDWTRPVRISGLQIRRDFSSNTSFVTDPSLSYSGVAVLPSAVDVYIDAVHAWSGQVPAGPFTLSDVPTITPQGEAVFVLHDPTGADHISRVSFFSTQNLLRAGVWDYALQAGFAREDYGQASSDYGKTKIGLGSARFGLTDRLTLSAQIEATTGLTMAGGGVDTVLFNRAEVSLSAAQSRSDAGRGNLVAFALHTKIGEFDLRTRHRRSFGAFEDLATYLTLHQADPVGVLPAYVPAQLEQALSLSLPIVSINGMAGLSYLHSLRDTETASIVSATYARPFGKGTLRINGFTDLSNTDNFGVSVGLSLPLGKGTYAGAQVTQTPRGIEPQSSVARQAGHDTGDTGYRISVYGQDGALSSAATFTRQGRYARSDLTLRSRGDMLSVGAAASGSLVLAGGSVFLANRIQDGYAVANVGASGVSVSVNNRPAAVTGWRGRALLTDLRSYQSNRISINPLDLPPNISITASAMDVVPMRTSGVVVTFGGSTGSSALIVLRDADGAFLPVGTPITLSETGASFPMGYDGEVWIEELRATNHVIAVVATGQCSASFAFVADPTSQVYIDHLICQ